MKIVLFPTLKGYKSEYFAKDAFAGLIIAAMTIPISMGYAEISGLTAVYGLYGSILPLVLFAMFSTSKQFIFGVDAAPAAIIGSALVPLGIVAGSEEALKMVPVIAFLTGAWLLLFYIMKAGRVVSFISTPVMGGFISGIAVTIILMQVPKILGSKAAHGELFELMYAIFKALQSVNPVSVALGVGTLVIILVSKKLFPKFPMAIFVMAAGALLTYFFHIDDYGVALLASVEPGLPRIALPDFASVDVVSCLGTSITVAVVIMAETLLAENNFAFKNGYKLDDNAEIFACATGNIAASLTGCCSVNGSVSRTAMGEQFGGRTQMMSIVAAVLLTVLLVSGTGFIGYLPVPVLTAIVITALMSVVEHHLAVRLFKVSRSEFWIFMAAFMSVLVLGTIYGVVIGIVLSFAEVVLSASKPPRAFLGVIPGHGNFYDLKRNHNAKPIENVIIYKFSGNLFFANINALQDDIENALKEDTKCVVLHAGGISSIDITAADRLEMLYASLKERGIKFYMTEHIAAVNDQLRKFGFVSLIEEGFVKRTITLALRDAGYEKPYKLVGMDDVEALRMGYIELKTQEEEALEEYSWAFGEFAPMQIKKDVGRIIENISESDISDVVDGKASLDTVFNHAHIWSGIGMVDEDELLRRLEMHVSELAKRLHNNEITIAELLEDRRNEIAGYLETVNPQAAKKLYEHQDKLDEMLRRENPEGYERLVRFRDEIKKKNN
ncbi:MAG: SulP family inorganic anion transporter [Clostridia bacterium]|nr:SulP family inorganic anion transporter [Clostridia bacterium]